MDRQGNFLFLNEFASSFFGYTKEELLGRNVVGTILPFQDSTGRDLSEMWLDIVNNPDEYVANENENIRRNGERVWVVWTNKALFDRNGVFTEILCVGNDITERKQAEKEMNELQRLQQVQKIETVMQLAGGVAHDFNNLLTAIIGNLTLIKMNASDTILDQLNAASDAANRAAKLVQELFNFNRKITAGTETSQYQLDGGKNISSMSKYHRSAHRNQYTSSGSPSRNSSRRGSNSVGSDESMPQRA